MRRRTINRIISNRLNKVKQVVDYDVIGEFSSAATSAIIAIAQNVPQGVVVPPIINPRSRITSIYAEISYGVDQQGWDQMGAPPYGEMHWCIFYSPQNGISGSDVDPTTQGTLPARNYVFKSGFIHVTPSMSHGKVVGVIKIPRKYQRLMSGDVIRFAFRSTSTISLTNSWENFSVKFIYKEIQG